MGVRGLLFTILRRFLRFSKSIVTVIELGDVTSIVLRDHETPTRVYFLIAIDAENQIVANYNWFSQLNGLLDLLWCPFIQLSSPVKMFQELDTLDQPIVTFVVAT